MTATMSDFPGLRFSVAGNELMAVVEATAERPLLDVALAREAIDSAGYGAWFLIDEALGFLVEHYVTPGSVFALTVGERRDGRFTLEIAADAMQASIDVLPAYGGQPVMPDDIVLVLGKAGVTWGVDEAAVRLACASTTAGRFVVATGVPAVDGEDSRFEVLINDVRDRTPQLNDDGLIDFRELGAIPTVSADEPLMRRIPATTGICGHNVRGEVLAPTPGRNVGFSEKLKGSAVDRADPNLLRAVCSGQPIRLGNGVNVEPVLTVRNVNMASGNITFDGTVKVEGEVLPGMKVKATGDIFVAGVVDGAELTAGGDIHVGGGVIAHAVVVAAGAVSARFVEGARLSAGTVISIDDSALQADLQANNQVLVGLKSTQRGRLAGGTVRTMMLVRTPVLGSSTSGVTRLLLGVNPVLEAAYQELQQQVAKRREEEQNLEKVVKHLEKKGDKSGMLERARTSWQQAVQAWGRLLPERDALERQMALIQEARIEVGQGVAGALDLTFAGKSQRVRNLFGPGAFSVVNEAIVFTSPTGQVYHAS